MSAFARFASYGETAFACLTARMRLAERGSDDCLACLAEARLIDELSFLRQG